MSTDIQGMPTRTMDERKELHDEHIPGTDLMRDHDGLHLKRSGGGKGVVLVPQPSNSRDDPLNWSPYWKAYVIGTQALFVWVTVLGPLSLPPLNEMLAEEWDLDQQAVGMLTGACVLSLGFANFIIVPCSNIFGRRITAIVTCILAMVFTVWEAVATSHKSFLASRIMNGMATAVNETMMVQVIADVFFIHQRGRLMTFYFTSFFLGLFIGPIISGNIGEKHGWRSFFWLCVGLGGFNLINLIVGFPETRYSRQSTDIHSKEHMHDASAPHLEDEGVETKGEVRHVEEGHTEDSWTGRGRPSKKQWKLWQPIDPRWRHTLYKDIISPWAKFGNPIILWAGITVFGAANNLLYYNMTESVFLGAPPYSFSPSAMGYTNFAFVVGGLFGLATAGPLSDWLAMYQTKRNGGVREAEFRLPALIPYACITTCAMVVGAVGFDRHWDWPIMVVVAYGFTGVTVTSIPSIACAYAVDCYTPISGDIMVVVTVFKNTIGFSLSYWIFDVIAKKGILTCTMIQYALVIGPVACAIPLYLWGKHLRRLTRNSGWHQNRD